MYVRALHACVQVFLFEVLPLRVIPPFFFALFAYWLIGLHPGWVKYTYTHTQHNLFSGPLNCTWLESTLASTCGCVFVRVCANVRVRALCRCASCVLWFVALLVLSNVTSTALCMTIGAASPSNSVSNLVSATCVYVFVLSVNMIWFGSHQTPQRT